MNFKKTKAEVINDAFCAADSHLMSGFNSLKHQLGYNSPIDNLDQIKMVVSASISAAITSLVENIYTDEEFEKDLTLKS